MPSAMLQHNMQHSHAVIVVICPHYCSMHIALITGSATRLQDSWPNTQAVSLTQSIQPAVRCIWRTKQSRGMTGLQHFSVQSLFKMWLPTAYDKPTKCSTMPLGTCTAQSNDLCHTKQSVPSSHVINITGQKPAARRHQPSWATTVV